MLYNGLPLYEITADDDFEMTCISIVDEPAVERDFIKFKSEKIVQNFTVSDSEQQNILGVAIRADFPVYRFDENGGYYVTFTKEAIKEIVKQYSKDGFFNQVSLQHDGKRVDGVTLVELFIKDVDNGINPKGFEDVENGSLFVCYHVDNKQLWDEIKTSGELNGFSIEIYTTMSETDEDPTLEELIEALLTDEKKKFSVSGDIAAALRGDKVVNIATKNGTINNAQVYQIGRLHGKNVAIVWGENQYESKQWYVEPIRDITKVTPTNEPFTSWNAARQGASWQNVEALLDSEELATTQTAVVPQSEFERAIIEHKMCIITYRDASEEDCIYSRQCGVFEYGYNFKGHAALRAYQYYGSTHTVSEGWKMFLLSRILSFRVLDYMKPIEEAPQGFRYSGEDRDGFVCLLRADYLS